MDSWQRWWQSCPQGLRQFLWFIGLWMLGVSTLTAVAWLLRLPLG